MDTLLSLGDKKRIRTNTDGTFMSNRKKSPLVHSVDGILVRDVDVFDKNYTATVDSCCLFDSLPRVCQRFVTGLEINGKKDYILEIVEIC